MVDLATSSQSEILKLLERHPRVREAAEGPETLRFHQGAWTREVRVGDPSVELKGLVELMDNNPIVCADVVSVPSAASTLALIALGPIAAAGLILERPSLMASPPADEAELDAFLATAGWPEGVAYQKAGADGTIEVATAMALVRTLDDLSELDDLYEERFGRSFFVHRDDEAALAQSQVAGSPNAFYHLRVTEDEPNSLLTVFVIADRDGKCGAAQVVHAMNVMCGFEESLGL